MSAPPMSTPIANIPISQVSQPTEEDPEVMAILQEMQNVPQPQAHTVSMQRPVQQPMVNHPVMTPSYGVPQNPMMIQAKVSSKPAWFQSELAQRAIYASLIAFILFYPSTLEIVYQKIAVLEKFRSYDSIVRFLLLAVILYVLMWKFQI
jgi:hypothetical protein